MAKHLTNQDDVEDDRSNGHVPDILAQPTQHRCHDGGLPHTPRSISDPRAEPYESHGALQMQCHRNEYGNEWASGAELCVMRVPSQRAR
jgi:hypothetical protein